MAKSNSNPATEVPQNFFTGGDNVLSDIEMAASHFGVNCSGIGFNPAKNQHALQDESNYFARKTGNTAHKENMGDASNVMQQPSSIEHYILLSHKLQKQLSQKEQETEKMES